MERTPSLFYIFIIFIIIILLLLHWTHHIFFFLYYIIEHHYSIPTLLLLLLLLIRYDDICLGFLSSLRSSVLSPWLNMSDKFPTSIAFDLRGRRRRGYWKRGGRATQSCHQLVVEMDLFTRSRAHSVLGTPETRRNWPWRGDSPGQVEAFYPKYCELEV